MQRRARRIRRENPTALVGAWLEAERSDRGTSPTCAPTGARQTTDSARGIVIHSSQASPRGVGGHMEIVNGAIPVPEVGDVFGGAASHPVRVRLEPQLERRNRLTTAFRPILALPHLVLVGGPLAFLFSQFSRPEPENFAWQFGGGVFGAVAFVAAVIGWFAIVFAARYPDGLWNLTAYYLRWRVRAVAYTALLRDEYPPFGDGAYPARVLLTHPGARSRLTVAFRPFLALPQLLCVWVLGIAWAFSTLIAWFAILFTGRYPAGLYRFGVGVLRWTTRVEAYVLLLEDAYPPFSLE
jgi:hypothetical protein